MKKNKTTFIMVLFFFIGLMVLFYPSISDYTNQKIQSKTIMKYEELLKKIEVVDYSKYFDEAKKYNQKLLKINQPLVNYKKLGDTSNILSVNSTGMIGYIEINKIKVELPIYYGTDANTLNTSVGLLEGTSFPIGGLGTHSVLSAHRGLPSSKLFTDIDKLELEDTFIVKILDQTLTYEIDQIRIVKPDELNDLEIDSNSDYISLMTCTPYGINSHRLLVRGHRIENIKAKTYASNEAFKINRLIVTPIACFPILIFWLIAIAFRPIEKRVDYKMMYVYPLKYVNIQSKNIRKGK